jgi:hypothetical protein
MGYILANGAIGISLRENGRYIAHSVRALFVSAPVPEREKDRGCDKKQGFTSSDKWNTKWNTSTRS